MVTVLGLATIIRRMANNQGGHPWDCLVDFDHFKEGDLPKDSDYPKNGDTYRDGDYSRDGGCLRDFHHPK